MLTRPAGEVLDPILALKLGIRPLHTTGIDIEKIHELEAAHEHLPEADPILELKTGVRMIREARSMSRSNEGPSIVSGTSTVDSPGPSALS